MKRRVNLSLPCAAIAEIANARAVPRTSPPPASPALDSASSREPQGDMSQRPTAATTSSGFLRRLWHTALRAGRDSPRHRRASRLHPGRSQLVQARCRHFHEKRTAVGPRTARCAEARHLPAWTILSDRAFRQPTANRNPVTPGLRRQVWGRPTNSTSTGSNRQGMYDPPLTCTTWPVMALASSDARNTAVRAI